MGQGQDIDGTSLGRLIAQERRRHSLSRPDLARLVRKAAAAEGVRDDRTSDTSVKRWELYGLVPRTDHLRWLAAALGLPVQRLVLLARHQAADTAVLELPPTAPADHGYVEAVRTTIGRLVGLEVQYGGSDIADLGVHSFRAAHRRIAAGVEPALARDLQAATAELAEVAGWLLHDADRQEAAHQMNNEGLFLARLSGDRSMELFILANASLQALFTRRPGEALMISNAVLDAGGLTGRERVIFTTRQARALAQLGDRGAALRLMDEAQATFWDGASGRDPAWAWWVDAAEVRAHIALAHGDLGNVAKAAELLQRSVEDCPPPRAGARFIYLAQQLRAAVQTGAWDDALTVIEQALLYVGEVHSGRTLGLLRDGIHRIEAAGAPPRLRDAGHHLDSVLTAVGCAHSPYAANG
jgi:tetratricopeptide (TPR) repeat protein